MKFLLNSTPAPVTATATRSEYAEVISSAKAGQWIGGVTGGQLQSLRATARKVKGAEGKELFLHATKGADGLHVVEFKAEPSARGRKRGG
jgi:hypothetical protein